MFRRQSGKYRRFGWTLLGMVLFCTICATVSGGQAPRVGTLHLDGNGIEFLTLQDDTGRERVFKQPGADVVLPQGRYRVQQIILLGPRACRPGELPMGHWLTVEPNTPATLHIGGPLRQVIGVNRRGSIMVLNYSLVGQGGEHYNVDRDQNRPAPSFAVYRGDHQVASGDFEFG